MVVSLPVSAVITGKSSSPGSPWSSLRPIRTPSRESPPRQLRRGRPAARFGLRHERALLTRTAVPVPPPRRGIPGRRKSRKKVQKFDSGGRRTRNLRVPKSAPSRLPTTGRRGSKWQDEDSHGQEEDSHSKKKPPGAKKKRARSSEFCFHHQSSKASA